MPLPELLEHLLTTPGPSGQERAVAAVWREAAAPVGEVSSDVLGSSWVRVPGVAGGPSLALVGHIDEIGAVVTHLGDDGFAALRPLGGFDPHTMLGQRVDVLTREGAVPGVVAGRQQKRKRGEDRKPLDYDDLSDHAALQKRLKTPICLDESIKTVAIAREAIGAGACRIINIKPGRVGGFGESIRLHDLCASCDIPVWHGGMLESGIGRAANIHLSTLPNFTLPGDVAASRRYFDPDLIDPPIEKSTPVDDPLAPRFTVAVRAGRPPRLATSTVAVVVGMTARAASSRCPASSPSPAVGGSSASDAAAARTDRFFPRRIRKWVPQARAVAMAPKKSAPRSPT